jgi:hypothetical protein
MKSFNGPVKKLLFADELLSTGTKWTLTYIDKLRMRYESEIGEPSDDEVASDDGEDDEEQDAEEAEEAEEDAESDGEESDD